MDPQILLYQGFGYITHYPATCPQPAAMVYLFFLFDQYIFQVSKETSYFLVYRCFGPRAYCLFIGCSMRV